MRSSVSVEYEGLRLLVDAGPDFRSQLLREDISHIDAILLTHNHKDHTGGLDDVRSFNYFEKRAFPMPETLGKGYWGSGHGVCIADFYASIREGRPYQNDLASVRDTADAMLRMYEEGRKTL